MAVAGASAYLEATTVHMTEYSGMYRGVQAALDHGATELSLGVIAYKQDSLMTQLNHHRKMVAGLKSVKYLHVVPAYNAAPDSLATEALKKGVRYDNHRRTGSMRSPMNAQRRFGGRTFGQCCTLPTLSATFATRETAEFSDGMPDKSDRTPSQEFFDFVREGSGEFGDLRVTTRQQARSVRIRVRVADESSA
ncbi:hypothetical protein PHMEG_0006018 [Phytophthora megakarya]|uniref:Uncharacterized protein n=1 Tax=Phytophthora megakarya TaxID=4795 RepID=A0A225WRM5_9STRA|nr:hypothetical protein PHMEG_0006018 [Phytophthora megakarya]